MNVPMVDFKEKAAEKVQNCPKNAYFNETYIKGNYVPCSLDDNPVLRGRYNLLLRIKSAEVRTMIWRKVDSELPLLFSFTDEEKCHTPLY